MGIGKSILHTEHRTVHDMHLRAEYYDDGTYSTWADDKPTVEYSLWEIRDGVFWFKHPNADWERVHPSNKYYQQSLDTAEALMALDFLEKVIADD